ncbi:coiled-coil domain-containing protein 78-like isoform X1 [Sinocyclocheilus rhinocerous]|uniref:coiled-coil domain-containing protein 78-like isoform X1 n=1 Tax=Sinocyclocheilus rhinocerous TaxID=307959 RepID=UPI0007B9CDE8|nr:PREDICTED: coiled-coil domain-containing protein 78-like isoform X1 [Sinocyclocheilus rhinocerous]
MDSTNKQSSINELQEQIHSLTEENVQLRERNEALFSKLDSVQNKLGQQAASKSDLSVKLVQCEEDKLKISKDLVDVQIEANKMREQYEAEIFKLKNVVLSQEGTASSLQTECDRLRQEVTAASAHLEVIERSERDLAEEYAVLKSNFLSLSGAYERERTHSEELSAELLALAHTHDTLLQERERTHRHTLEVERVRALLSRTSQNRVRPEEFEQSKSQPKRNGVQNNLRDEFEKLRKSYEGHQRQLEEKVVAMGREQQENKRAIQSTRHELSQQSATLIISQHQLKEAEADVSKLQNHLKELNREYRARLTRYIQDVTVRVQANRHVECLTAAGEDDLGQKLKGFVESMLEEVKTSYRSREEQLTKAVRTYRKRIQGLSNTYQQLLIAYRLQREQILALPEHSLEAGPPEAHFSPTGTELRGETERELHRLREDKARLESQLKLAREQMAVFTEPSQRVGLTQDSWNDVQKQIREITNSTQEAQERERAQLITRATVAEEQVSELKEYVDNHLGRYKLEITRLRRLLGSQEGRSNSARTHKPRPLHKSLNSSSYEI